MRRSGNFKTKKEAQAAERKWLELSRPDAYVKENIQLVEYIHERYLPYVKQKVRYSTLVGYKRDINNRILPALGRFNIKAIETANVQSMINGCSSYKVAKNARDTLRQILNLAKQDGYITDNPAASQMLIFPKREVYPTDHNGTWLTTFKQHEEFLSKIDNEMFKNAALVGLSLGLRRGEIFGLDWEAVDLEKRLVHVKQTYVEGDNGFELKPPKNEQSDRYIPIRMFATEYLRELYKRLGEPQGAVLTDEDGNRHNPHSFSLRWMKYVEKNGLEPVTLLNMRHSFATACIDSGIGVLEVSRMLGHASYETTTRRYIRFKSEEMVGLMDKHTN